VGLDAGDHQEGWNPYLGTPERWNHGDRPENDDTEMGLSSFLTFVGFLLTTIITQRGFGYIIVPSA